MNVFYKRKDPGQGGPGVSGGEPIEPSGYEPPMESRFTTGL